MLEHLSWYAQSPEISHRHWRNKNKMQLRHQTSRSPKFGFYELGTLIKNDLTETIQLTGTHNTGTRKFTYANMLTNVGEHTAPQFSASGERVKSLGWGCP